MYISTQCGVGFMGLLFVTFLVLKLTHVINWSWWWITAPLWGPVAMVFIIFCFVFANVWWEARKANRLYRNK